VLDLGGRSVMISHPGFGHTCHDLIVVVADAGPPVVFCGDLVEESGDPTIGPDPDPKAWPATLARGSMRAGPTRHMCRGMGGGGRRVRRAPGANPGHWLGVTNFARLA
jgi:hypothetical protein